MIARTKNTLAVALTNACVVAVRLSGVPGVIVSQSTNPVRTVTLDQIAPTTSASHQAYAPLWAVIPRTWITAAIVANVYAPIVASVRGGWIGWPGRPRHR